LDEANNLYSGKLTWNISSSTTIVGSVFADPSSSSGAAAADPLQGPSGRVIGSAAIVNRDQTTWYSTRVLGGTDFGLRANQILGATGLLALQGSYHKDRNLLTAPPIVRTEDFTCGGTPDKECSPLETPNTVFGGYGWIDGQKDHNLSHRWQLR